MCYLHLLVIQATIESNGIWNASPIAAGEKYPINILQMVLTRLLYMFIMLQAVLLLQRKRL